MEGSSTLEEKAISLVVAKLANIKGAKVSVDKNIDPKVKNNPAILLDLNSFNASFLLMVFAFLI